MQVVRTRNTVPNGVSVLLPDEGPRAGNTENYTDSASDDTDEFDSGSDSESEPKPEHEFEFSSAVRKKRRLVVESESDEEASRQ